MYRSTNPGDENQPIKHWRKKAKQRCVHPTLRVTILNSLNTLLVKTGTPPVSAKKISDVIRQMQLYEENRETQSQRMHIF